MRRVYLLDIGLLVLAGTLAGVLANEPEHPAKPPTANIEGEATDRPDMAGHTEDGAGLEHRAACGTRNPGDAGCLPRHTRSK